MRGSRGSCLDGRHWLRCMARLGRVCGGRPAAMRSPVPHSTPWRLLPKHNPIGSVHSRSAAPTCARRSAHIVCLGPPSRLSRWVVAHPQRRTWPHLCSGGQVAATAAACPGNFPGEANSCVTSWCTQNGRRVANISRGLVAQAANIDNPRRSCFQSNHCIHFCQHLQIASANKRHSSIPGYRH